MTSDRLIIELPGPPRGKGRPRFSRKGFAYTDAKTASYEGALRQAAAIAMNGRAPLTGPLQVHVSAYFGVPQSWPKKKRADALDGRIFPTGRPDADNICKTLDALNGIAFVDDAQCVAVVIDKFYDERPRLWIEVRERGPMQ